MTSYGCHNSRVKYINQGISLSPYKVQLDSGTKAQYISFENPHINAIVCYRNDIPYDTIGDSFDFDDRLMPSRYFIVPLDSTESTNQSYTFLVSKLGENLSFKWELFNQNELEQKLKQENIFLGIVIGTFGFIISIGLILLIVTKEKNEIFFLIYLLLSMTWLMNEMGFPYQYIWPDSPKFHQLSRTIFSSLSLSSYVIMIFKSYQPKLKLSVKLFMTGFLLFIATRVIFLLIRASFNLEENVKIIIVYANAIVLLVLFVYLLRLLNKKVFTENTNIFEKAGIYLYWTIVVSETLHQLGFDMFGAMQGSSEFIYAFFLIQIITTAISVSLSYYNKKISIENERQALIINQEKKVNQSLLSGQKLERERIGKNLHDEVGSLLASIKLNIATIKNKSGDTTIKKDLDELLYLVDLTIENKYQIIYDLAPVGHDSDSLKVAILKRIKLYRNHTKIEFDINIDDTINLSEISVSTLYRIILELLNNGIKHSKATKIILNAVHDSLGRLVIDYLDNGIGFNIEETIKKGGLKTILINLKSMNVQYEFNSNSHGTHFTTIVSPQVL